MPLTLAFETTKNNSSLTEEKHQELDDFKKALNDSKKALNDFKKALNDTQKESNETRKELNEIRELLLMALMEREALVKRLEECYLYYSNPIDYLLKNPEKQFTLHAAIQAAAKRQDYGTDNRFNEAEATINQLKKMPKITLEPLDRNAPIAAMQARHEMLNDLLELFAKCASFSIGWTPENSNYATVRKILECENIHNVLNLADEQGNLPIHYAAADPKMPPDIFTQFIKRGAALDKKNNSGESPLHVAIKSDNQAFVETLLKDGDSVLHYAARHNLADLAEACIAQDPKAIYAINNNGQTPANVAFSVGNDDVAKTIVNALNSQMEKHRQALESKRIRTEEILRQLLFKEQKTNAATTKRTTETEQAFPFLGKNARNAQPPAPEINPTKEQQKAPPVNRHLDASQLPDETRPKMN